MIDRRRPRPLTPGSPGAWTRQAALRAWFGVVAALTCLGGCQRSGPTTVITLGHSLDTSHSVHRAMVFMGERLAELSAGTMRLDIYPNQQLGSEREAVELLQIGSLGMTKVSSSVLEAFAPAYQVLGLPYVFRDDAHRFAVLEGDVGRDILASATDYNLRGLAYYDAGTRSFYTKDRAVRAPDDLSGLKIRTQESPSAVRLVRTFGGSATPIAWGELYTALQQGVVDAAENNPPSFYLARHYEVCRYYIIDEHTASPDVLVISTIVWDALTPDEQGWLARAAAESAEYQKGLWAESVTEAMDAVAAAGVEIIHPDKAPFVARVQPIYDEVGRDPVLRDLLARMARVDVPEAAAVPAAEPEP